MSRAVEVWDRFQADYPGYRGGTYVDAIEGPVWVYRDGRRVRVAHQDWADNFRLGQADQLTLSPVIEEEPS